MRSWLLTNKVFFNCIHPFCVPCCWLELVLLKHLSQVFLFFVDFFHYQLHFFDCDVLTFKLRETLLGFLEVISNQIFLFFKFKRETDLVHVVFEFADYRPRQIIWVDKSSYWLHWFLMVAFVRPITYVLLLAREISWPLINYWASGMINCVVLWFNSWLS